MWTVLCSPWELFAVKTITARYQHPPVQYFEQSGRLHGVVQHSVHQSKVLRLNSKRALTICIDI